MTSAYRSVVVAAMISYNKKYVYCISFTTELYLLCSLVTRLSPLLIPALLFKFVCREGESLVYFDYVLDVVGRGYTI